MSATAAVYITPEQAVGAPRSRGRFLVTLLTFLATIFIALVTVVPVPGISKSPGHVASAGFPELFCSSRESLGSDMGKNPWRDPLRYYAHEDLAGRHLTLDEAVGEGLSWYTYEGEGGGSSWTVDVGKDRGAMYPKFKDSAINKRLMDARSPSTCIFVSLMDSGANLGLQLAKGITAVGQTAAVVVFDSSFICSDPTKNSGHCLNLVGIVGGTDGSRGSHQGIIGMLTTSVYMPLLVIVAAAAAFWILWNGVVKGRVRDAVFGVCWVLISVILGIGFLQYPLLIAKAPMVASNAVASCVIGAFNGMDCTDGSATGTKTSLTNGDAKGGAVCQSTATGGANGVDAESSMSLAITSVTCSIWKAFILEPYAQGNFNKSYEDLDVDNPSTAAQIKSVNLDPKDYCVNTSITKSLADNNGNTLELDGSEAPICNVVAYQLSLGTDVNNKALDNAPNPPKDKRSTNPDVNWYKVILFGARDGSAWNTWGPSITQGMNRIMLSGIMMITALLGNALIVLISFNALVYYLTSAILIAFIPLFLLFGVHPGRGRKILIGYAEKVLSNIMKYLASAIFLVITIAFYGGILGSLTSIGATLIFVIIITAALYVNREQIIELIGRVNMGGEQLASKAFSQTTAGRAAKRVANKGQKVTKNAIGGGIGSIVANSGNGKSVIGNFATGASRGTMRELKRGHTMMAGTLREIDNVARDNREDLRREGDAAAKKADVALTAANSNKEMISLASSRMDEKKIERNEAEETLKDTATRVDQLQGAQEAVLKNVDHNGVSPDFARMEAIAARLQNLKLQHSIAIANHDTTAAASIQGVIDREQGSYDNLRARYNSDPQLLASHQSSYNLALQEELAQRGVSMAPTVMEQLSHSDTLANAYQDYAEKRAEANFATNSYNSLVKTRNDQLATWAKEQATSESLAQRYTDFGHDEFYSRGKLRDELAAIRAPRTKEEYNDPKGAFDEKDYTSKMRKTNLDRQDELLSLSEEHLTPTSAVAPEPELPSFNRFATLSDDGQPQPDRQEDRPQPDKPQPDKPEDRPQPDKPQPDKPEDRPQPDKPEDRPNRQPWDDGGSKDRQEDQPKPQQEDRKPSTTDQEEARPQPQPQTQPEAEAKPSKVDPQAQPQVQDTPSPSMPPVTPQQSQAEAEVDPKPQQPKAQTQADAPRPVQEQVPEGKTKAPDDSSGSTGTYNPTSPKRPEAEPYQGHTNSYGNFRFTSPQTEASPNNEPPFSPPPGSQGQGGQDDFGDEG